MEQEAEQTISVDPLKALYYERVDNLEREEDLVATDITGEFYNYLSDKIENSELINIAIKGEVSGSKSTSAIAIMNDINTLLEHKHKKSIKRFNSIFSDQTEFLRFINANEENIAIVIDEFSRIAQTGLNSSTEEALFGYFSDVFAQKYIHRISCSPAYVADLNSNVILEFIGKDVEKKMSKFIVRYRNSARGMREWTLGHVYIDVSRVIDQKFYLRYRQKKFDRMALLDKHGVRDIRELEFADSILDVVDELKDIVADGAKTEITDMVLAVISKDNREKKRIYSMMVTGEIASRCRNILNLYADLSRTAIKLDKSKSEVERDRVSRKMEKIKSIVTDEMNEQENRRRIYNEYLQIT